MREEHLGYRETAERFHIRHGRVQDWERIYLTEGPEGFSVERRGRGSKGRPKQLPKEVEEDLLAEVQRLVYSFFKDFTFSNFTFPPCRVE